MKEAETIPVKLSIDRDKLREKIEEAFNSCKGCKYDSGENKCENNSYSCNFKFKKEAFEEILRECTTIEGGTQ